MISPKKKVIIFGTNDFAELALYYLTFDSDYEVHGFTKNANYIIDGEKYYERPVVPFEELNKHFPPTEYYLFAPMSGNKMNNIRKNIYLEGLNKGYRFISYVSSKCTDYSVSIGDNCFILENNVLQPFTEIGNNVILWSGNHIGHHSKIEDHSFFTSHVVLSGHCLVKERSWFGVNSTIRDGLTIGEGSLIAMGSLITKSTDENGFYMGSPAKKQEKTSLETY